MTVTIALSTGATGVAHDYAEPHKVASTRLTPNGHPQRSRPQGAPLLDLEHAFDVAESPATRLCTLCGCAQELEPLLSGFDRGFDPES
jgi:hypothetical protein